MRQTQIDFPWDVKALGASAEVTVNCDAEWDDAIGADPQVEVRSIELWGATIEADQLPRSVATAALAQAYEWLAAERAEAAVATYEARQLDPDL